MKLVVREAGMNWEELKGGKEFYKIYYMKLSEKKNTKWARLSQMNLSLFSSLTYINNSSFVDFVGKKKQQFILVFVMIYSF